MKRLFALVLAVLLIMSVPAYAAQTSISAAALEVKPGETISISVEISNNTGLAAWMVEMNWDNDALEYIPDSVSAGKGFSSGTLVAGKGDNGKLKVTWFSTKNVAANGTMFTIQMKVKDSASGRYTIQLKCSEDNTIDVNENPVPVSVQNVTLTVKGDSAPPTMSPKPDTESEKTDVTPEKEPTKEETPEENNSAESDGDRTIFSDIPREHWAYSSINTLAACGIVSGVGGGRFDPDSKVTRAEFMKMLAGLIRADVTGKTADGMTDVDPKAWYAPYVGWALETGVTKGTSKTTFSPASALTREQAATLLYRFAVKNGIEIPVVKDAVEFRDADKISSYAVEAVSAMQQAGILSGTGNGLFQPQGTTTRAAAAKMLAMVLENIDE